MTLLLAASLIWAFSFGLIKHRLVGLGLDPNFVALVRLCLSLALFLPFLRVRRAGIRLCLRLVALGAVQYGLMYLYYLNAYYYLASHQVALFTIFTPLYVTLIHDALGRRFHRRFLAAALLAVVGAGVIVAGGRNVAGAVTGLALMQVSNICFAVGQVCYRRLLGPEGAARVKDREVFALLYLGGALAAAAPAALTTPWAGLCVSTGQWVTLLYLGVVPSGLCFFLWNLGARRTNAGMLAAMNNAKIPLAVLVSLAVFAESADVPRLVIGGAVMLAAVLLARRRG